MNQVPGLGRKYFQPKEGLLEEEGKQEGCDQGKKRVEI